MKKRVLIAMAVVLLLTTALPIATVGADPGPGIVGLWHLDEASGATTVADSSVNDNTGAIHGPTPGAAGKFGNALSFDGDGDYVDFGTGVSSLITGDYTVEAWIKPASLSSGRHAVVSFRYMELGQDAGKVYFWQAYDSSWGKGYQYTSPWVLLDVTKFSHIVGVFHKDAGVDLYVDGNYIGSDTTKTGTTLNIFGNTYAGVWYQMPPAGPGGAWFNGLIDEVRIWDEALTSSEVAALLWVEWLPPITLPNWTLNENATLPIKFQLRDRTGSLVTTDVGPSLAVRGPEAGSLTDLRFDSDEYYYISNFRPVASGWHTAVVSLNGGVELDFQRFLVEEPGKGHGKGKGSD